MPTAITPPATGPTRYAHHAAQSPLTRTGPSDRAGFIDAPLTGDAHNPASAVQLAPPRAASRPICCAPDAGAGLQLNRPAGSTISHSIAATAEIPLPGRVSPALPCLPTNAHSTSVAKIAPRSWATT